MTVGSQLVADDFPSVGVLVTAPLVDHALFMVCGGIFLEESSRLWLLSWGIDHGNGGSQQGCEQLQNVVNLVAT